jgi:hypothetical protein
MNERDSTQKGKLKKSWKKWLNEEVGYKGRTEAQGNRFEKRSALDGLKVWLNEPLGIPRAKKVISNIERRQAAVRSVVHVEGYLGKLEELKIRGEITDQTYNRLKNEYFARIVKNTKTSTEAADMMKFCRFCGTKIPRDSRFCGECGTRLET